MNTIKINALSPKIAFNSGATVCASTNSFKNHSPQLVTSVYSFKKGGTLNLREALKVSQ